MQFPVTLSEHNYTQNHSIFSSRDSMPVRYMLEVCGNESPCSNSLPFPFPPSQFNTSFPLASFSVHLYSHFHPFPFHYTFKYLDFLKVDKCVQCRTVHWKQMHSYTLVKTNITQLHALSSIFVIVLYHYYTALFQTQTFPFPCHQSHSYSRH